MSNQAGDRSTVQEWQASLKEMNNAALVDYCLRQVEENRERRLNRRNLFYRINGQRFWWIRATPKNERAYVWQYHRFLNDEDYWQNRLSHPNDVEVKNSEKGLAFNLYTKADFEKFHTAVTQDLVELLKHEKS